MIGFNRFNLTRTRAISSFVASLILVPILGVAAPSNECGIPPGTERCESWVTRHHPPSGSSRFNDIALSPDGTRIYAAGWTPGAGTDFITAAYGSSGQTLWIKQYDGPGAGNDQVIALAISPDGSRLFVTGPSLGTGTGNDFATIAYDTEDGTQLWIDRYDGPYNRSEWAAGVAVSSDGSRVYVTGYSDAVGINIDAATLAYDASTGVRIWEKRFDGPAGAWDTPQAIDAGIVATPSGGREYVFITTRSNVQGSGNDQVDVMTIAYDGLSGEQKWTSAYDGPSKNRDFPYALRVSPDGTRVYVAAEAVAPGRANDFAAIAFDSLTGAIIWSALYDGGFGDDRALSVAVSPNGDRIAITGFGPNQPGLAGAFDRSAITVVYDRNGNMKWAAKNTSLGGEAASKALFSSDGQHVYVTGLTVGQAIGGGVYIEGSGQANYVHLNAFLTIGYDAQTGSRKWVARYRDPGSSRALVVSPNGSFVYVAGGGTDAIVLAYETGE